MNSSGSLTRDILFVTQNFQTPFILTKHKRNFHMKESFIQNSFTVLGDWKNLGVF